jgi:hypothetical protein
MPPPWLPPAVTSASVLQYSSHGEALRASCTTDGAAETSNPGFETTLLAQWRLPPADHSLCAGGCRVGSWSVFRLRAMTWL